MTEIEKFIWEIDSETFAKIRGSLGDASCRRALSEFALRLSLLDAEKLKTENNENI